MSSERARRFQEKLHQDFVNNAERNEANGARYAAAWWAWQRGETTAAPVAADFELAPHVAESIATQCAIEWKAGKR